MEIGFARNWSVVASITYITIPLMQIGTTTDFVHFCGFFTCIKRTLKKLLR